MYTVQVPAESMLDRRGRSGKARQKLARASWSVLPGRVQKDIINAC